MARRSMTSLWTAGAGCACLALTNCTMVDGPKRSSGHEGVVWLSYPEENLENPKRVAFNVNTDDQAITGDLPAGKAGVVSISLSIVKKDSIGRMIDKGNAEFFGSYYGNFKDSGSRKFGLLQKTNDVIPSSKLLSDEIYQDRNVDPSLFIYCPASGNNFVPLCHLQSNRREFGMFSKSKNAEVLIEMMINQHDLPRWKAIYQRAVEVAQHYVFVESWSSVGN